MIDAKLFPPWVQKLILKHRMWRNNGHLYALGFIGNTPCITCLVCGCTSCSKGDIEYKFCIRCGYYSDAERDLYAPAKNPYAG